MYKDENEHCQIVAKQSEQNHFQFKLVLGLTIFALLKSLYFRKSICHVLLAYFS